MHLLGKIKRFWQMPWQRKSLFFEAYCLSLWAFIALKWLPFKYVQERLGTVTSIEPPLNSYINVEELALIRQISDAIRLCSKYAFWRCVCYHQTLMATTMLRRRGVSSVAYFGFKRNHEGQIEGHAWVKSQGIVVAGHGNLAQYSVNTMYH
jgi:hypothetical protein